MSKNQINIYQIVGSRIKQLRLQKGLTLKQISQKSGMSVYFLNKIEKGEVKSLTLFGTLKIANAMSVNIDDIFQDL